MAHDQQLSTQAVTTKPQGIPRAATLAPLAVVQVWALCGHSPYTHRSPAIPRWSSTGEYSIYIFTLSYDVSFERLKRGRFCPTIATRLNTHPQDGAVGLGARMLVTAYICPHNLLAKFLLTSLTWMLIIEISFYSGATELEDDDEIPITVMSPVDESEPNGDNSASAGPTSSSPGSPSETEGASSSRQVSPDDAMSPVASSLPNDLTPLPPWTSIYADAAPSYEAAMSTPNLHIYRERQDNVPLPPLTNPALTSPPISDVTPASPIHTSNSPTLGPSVSSPGSPVLNVNTASTLSPPGTTSPRPTVRMVTPQAPSATRTSPGSRSPASPSSPSGERGDGAETPRRRFGFMSLFHSRSSSRLRARSHSHSSAQAPSSSPGSGSAAPYPGRVASPDLLSPRPTRPFHRFSQSASGSMLNLSTCSRADN